MRGRSSSSLAEGKSRRAMKKARVWVISLAEGKGSLRESGVEEWEAR